jgi:drug/metabolite transporter (DMT)-like permease
LTWKGSQVQILYRPPSKISSSIVHLQLFLQYGVLMSEEPQAVAAQPSMPRSGLVTASGMVLVLLGGLCIAAVLYAVARPLWSDVERVPSTMPLVALPGLVVCVAGLATVERWRGWRVWAGTVSWLMIVFTALASMTLLMGPISVAASFLERLVTVFVSLAPGTVGAFALLAKQEEPTSDGGAAAARMVASIILMIVALLFLAGAVGLALFVEMDRTAATHASDALVLSAFFLFMALLFGYGGLAIIRRWRRGQKFAKILSWIMVVLLLLFGLAAVISGGPWVPFPGDPVGSRLAFSIYYGVLVGPFAFVLWALRRQRESRPA